jgi:hypothetical protein
MSHVGLVERAFQLAPECGSLRQLEQRLSKEGYSNVASYLSGPQIRTNLRERFNPKLKADFDQKIRAYRSEG